MRPQPDTSLFLFEPPYRNLERLGAKWPKKSMGRALVWVMGAGKWQASLRVARHRPPGLPLLVILPPAVELTKAPELMRVVATCRPHSILPYHLEPDTDDLHSLLTRPPTDLGAEVVDYIRWRGIEVDLQTRHLLRRVLDMAGDVRTVQGLARGLYISRRALGRRFQTRGIPVPSHWLHFGRILKVALKLQRSEENLTAVAYECGYSDGFVLSNQMERLLGVRPRDARRCPGWEWMVETWLQREARAGGLSVLVHRRFATPLGREITAPEIQEVEDEAESVTDVPEQLPSA